MEKKIRAVGAAVLVAVWAALTLWCWFGPANDVSESERRPLTQMPQIKGDAILSGKFMTDFEKYTLDQFPVRDAFRQLKALNHYYGLRQGDNNGIYIVGGFAVKQEYPLKQESVDYALRRFENLYETYFKESGSTLFVSVVPDKNYYLAEPNGYLAMDYGALFADVQAAMPWATYVDLTDCLTSADYYRTDTHWRQEKILDAAKKLCDAMGVSAFTQEEMTVTAVDRPFYGVYYGQAALPMAPETIYTLENPVISGCTVYQFETGLTSSVYDMDKLTSRDLYDVFLSGAQSILTVENPNANTDRELIVFRDSFGSSLTPLLLKDYKTVTLVDIRYVSSSKLADLLDFHGQDVLFLYSTLVLNSSSAMR